MKDFWSKLTLFGKIKLIFATVLGTLTIIFAFQNINAVPMQFLTKEINVSLMLIILIAMGIGFLIATFLDYKKFNKKNKKVKSLVNQVEMLTEKVQQVKTEKISQEPKAPIKKEKQ